MALVTVDELRDYMDISFSNRQEDAAQLILDGLHSEIEFILRRPIEVGTFTENILVPEEWDPWTVPPYSYTYSGGGTYTVPVGPMPSFIYRLEQSPVISITSVSRQGPLDDDDTDLVVGTDYLNTEYGLYLYTAYGADRVTVTYTAGLAGENYPYFKLAILRAASREVQNLHDDVVGLKEMETRNVAIAETGFTQSEIAVLKRYKRKRI